MSASAKEIIFQSIREAIQPIDSPEPYPEYDEADFIAQPRLQSSDNLWSDFGRNFSAVNGRAIDSLILLMTWLMEQKYTVGYCAPELYHSIGKTMEDEGFQISCEFDRAKYEDYQFGITRASGAIAESGTVILTDKQTSDRLAALVPWVHVAVLDPEQLVRTIPDAIAKFGDHRNIIWATGPSKTADVEGILIEGVHGPGEQVCLLLDD